MKKQEMDVVSLRIIKLYFLGIRELNFPDYNKRFQQKDMELFIQLADIMENLTESDDFLGSYLVDLNEILLFFSSENYSRTVQRMLCNMKVELKEIS